MKAVLPAADNISVYFCIYIFKTQNENENKVMFLFIIDSKGCRGEVPAELKSLHSLKIMNSSSASVQTQNTGGLYAIIKFLFKGKAVIYQLNKSNKLSSPGRNFVYKRQNG